MKTLARQRDQVEILRRLRMVRPESARRWGRMTAHQMVCHLTDSMRMVIGEKPVTRAAGPLQVTVVKWFALYVPMRWPAGIPTTPELDQQLGGTRPGDFATDVGRLEALLERIVVKTKPPDSRRHPIFGRMSESAWLRWAYLHADHHLRQFGA